MVGKITKYMENMGVNFLNNCSPVSFAKNEDGKVVCEYSSPLGN